MSDRTHHENTSSSPTRLKESLPQNEPHLDALVRQRILQPMSAVKVANTVTFVNPDLASTNFTVGKPSELVFQIAMGPRKSTPDRIVYVRPNHNRSAIISAAAKTTSEKQTFPYLDAKGTGNLEDIERKPTDPHEHKYETYMSATKSRPDDNKPFKTWGQATRQKIENDMANSRKLKQLGIRTVPLIAIAEIAEIMDPSGEKISIAAAKTKGDIAQATDPVVLFRGWITPFRMAEVYHHPDDYKHFGLIITDKTIERKRSILIAAFEDMKHDTSIPIEVRNSFPGVDPYLKWVATSIGKDLGTMHANHLAHKFLNSLHNLTLDARFMDLDAMKANATPDDIATDKIALLNSGELYHASFLSYVPSLFNSRLNPSDLLHMTQDAYAHALATAPKF